MNNLERYECEDYILAMDGDFVSGANLKCVLDNDIRFVTPVLTDSKAIKTNLTKMSRRMCGTKIFDSHAYDVWETEVGLLLSDIRTSTDSGQAFSFIKNGSEDHVKDGELEAFVCFDSKKYSNEIQNRHLMLQSLIAHAKTIDLPNPVKMFR